MASRIYRGQLRTKADLVLLSKCLEDLKEFPSNGEIIANCVIVTPGGKKPHVDADDWVYEGESEDGLFRFYRHASLDPSRPHQKTTAVLGPQHLALRFTAYTFDKSGETPCHDQDLLQGFQPRVILTQDYPLALQRNTHAELAQRLTRAGHKALDQRINGTYDGNITEDPQVNAIFELVGIQTQLEVVSSLENDTNKDRVREYYLNLCDVTLGKLSGAMESLVKSLGVED
ncbi:hypothetical protein LTR41_011238 [Exophiala xenobiotica]|nr:hypothetical protein LTR41_011238 [Exophiala xenobiotica]KAK5550932.1 hypothetical protein LTR46_011075 [Exophiala xenobiotica]